MQKTLVSAVIVSALLGACATDPEPRPAPPSLEALRQQVWDRELAFAQTMADRDPVAFATFLSDDVVFVAPNEELRGPFQVCATWDAYFETPEAPFSWRPDRVVVLDSRDLALSTGPVLGPSGQPLGRFSTIWRLEGGAWRVVFDKGEGG